MPLNNPTGGVISGWFGKAESRALEAASGNVSYTGYGFSPKALIILASQNGGKILSFGLWAFGAAAQFVAFQTDTAGTFRNSASFCIFGCESFGTLEQKAVLLSLDGDGFTLTWTRVGLTAAGVLNFYVLALGTK